MWTNCPCGSTGGCPRCMPDNFGYATDIDKYNYSNLPKAQCEGWICTKCKTSNNPDNKVCEKCDLTGARAQPLRDNHA